MALVKKVGSSTAEFIADGVVTAALGNESQINLQNNVVKIGNKQYSISTINELINSYKYGAALVLGLIQT